MDIATLVTIGAGVVTTTATLGGIMWRISHHTGKSAAELGHLRGFCQEAKKKYEEQSATIHEHGTKIVEIQATVRHHGESLNRHEKDIHHLKGRRDDDG